MLATERAVNYLRSNVKSMHSGVNRASFLSRVGISSAELESLLSGDMLLDEPRFYKLLEACREYDYSGARDKHDCFVETPNWELVGLVEGTITLGKASGDKFSGIQGIVKVPTVIIDDSELYIEEGDILSRKYGGGAEERLTVERVESYRYQTGKPAYVLTVRRGKVMPSKKIEVHNTNFFGGTSVVQGDNSNATIGETSESSSINCIMGLLSKACSWIVSLFTWKS